MTPSQRAMDLVWNQHPSERHGMTVAEIADQTDVSVRSLRRAVALAKHRPDLVEKVLGGALTLRRAAKEIEEPSDGEIVDRVYFIRSDSGHIKIGSSTHPELRLAEFQIGCPHELTLLLSIPVEAGASGKRLEALIHDRFHAARHRGEWFNPTEDLLSSIETYRSENAD